MLQLDPLPYDELNQISIAREPTRTTQAVLELELAERDEEITLLRQQLELQNQKIPQDVNTLMSIIAELKSENQLLKTQIQTLRQDAQSNQVL